MDGNCKISFRRFPVFPLPSSFIFCVLCRAPLLHEPLSERTTLPRLGRMLVNVTKLTPFSVSTHLAGPILETIMAR